MSEAETEATVTKPKKTRKNPWNEKRRLSLLMTLLEGPKDTTELFEKFREVEKYRGLTFERVVREARAICKEAVNGNEEDQFFYNIDMPPARKTERQRRLTAADVRRALIAEHAKKLPKRKRDAIIKAQKEAAEAAAKAEEEAAKAAEAESGSSEA